jgi:2-keto-3-deoxy-L-rhamnonate aldolase RhmA
MMRISVVLSLVAAALLPATASLTPQTIDRMNPIIAAQEKGLPVLGIAHPAIARRVPARPGAAADPNAPPPPAPPPIVLADVAKETVAYTRADYLYTSGTSDTFLSYMEEIRKAGGSMRTHPFTAKIGIWHRSPENVTGAIVRQLAAGHVGVSMEAVESAQEVRDVIKAMRLVSAGGTRPDIGLEHAAAYWGLPVEEYRKKADVWPLNRNGELLISVIIESLPGLEKVREIAAEPGVGQIFAGYGTLGQVFRGDPAGREAAAAKILAACNEFKIPCGFPTNNPAEIEQRMKEGWSVFIMQRRDENGLAAVETARKLSGR